MVESTDLDTGLVQVVKVQMGVVAASGEGS
jgi:hypothetical protein